ncbi:glycosyltransferase family 4 protein, partial [Planktotalea sp.]|uniref:glycosyltransferase family 4 protein n=1 Tax=Planktotalea sp. TaxID=2029877 RepID=UPI003296EDA2
LDQSSHYENAPFDAYLESGLQYKPRLIFVSHDASRTGAPAIILRLLEMFSQSGDFECFSILDTGGERLNEFEALSHTHVMSKPRYNAGFSDEEALSEISRLFNEEGVFKNNRPVCALVNSAESLRIAQGLQRQGIPVISLIHEVAAYYPPEKFTQFGEVSEKVVFPSQFVKKAASLFSDMDMSKAWVRGQGLLTDEFGTLDRTRCRRLLRESLGIEEDAFVVLNVGTMDVRKGGDLFVDTAKICLEQVPKDKPLYFLWYGQPDPSFGYPKEAIKINGLEAKVRFMPSTSEIEQVFLGGDLFLLTARADPFPCVIHEALACGLPVVAFENGGGAPELIGDDCGQIVDMYDLAAMARTILSYVENPELGQTQSFNAIEKIKKDWDYFSYQKDLYELMQENAQAPESGWPELAPPVSPDHLVVMNASLEDLELFEQGVITSDQASLDVALIGGRFENEAEAVAAQLRQMGHRVRHHQPDENNIASRATLVSQLLVKPRPKTVTLLNTLRFVSPKQIRPLAYPLQAVETDTKIGLDMLYQALPYLKDLTLSDEGTVEALTRMNPVAKDFISFWDPKAAFAH